jgi:tetratricopeptide (TPR) repeat protein
MAYWGMGMSLAPYINMDGDPTYDPKASCAAIEKGLRIGSAPEREKAYLQAAAKRCPDDQPKAYADAMRALADRWPDDLDARTLYAESLMIPVRWRWYAPDGTPAPGVTDAERALEEVLRRWPEHPGANHYYIHAVESSRTPHRAVPSAQRLMGLVPAAGHMVHMPAHIWLVLGDWEMAASVNERAIAVDRQYFAQTGVNGPYSMYYVHNMHFLTYARWMQGNQAQSSRAAAEMTAALAPMVEAMPEMADAFAAVAALGRARFNEWDAILKALQPKPEMKASMLVWRYTRALALAARGDRAGGAREQTALEEMRKAIPADAQWGFNKTTDVAALASQVMAARLAPTPADAVPHWRQAVEMQDALTYDEPPAWYYPLPESLGAALLRAGNAVEAERVFRDGVERSPRNGRMLWGLMESLRAQQKAEEAEWVRKEFEAAWAKADVKLKVEEM